MNRVPVSSSNLASVGFDAEKKTLEIEFKNGSIFQYYNVPEKIYSGILSATSHGRYFDAYIKKGGFAFKQVK
jgi:hypothetical protein